MKLPGVTTADVSLNEGLARLELAPDNTVTPERVWQIVRSNGFTPRSAEVLVAGTVVERAGETRLQVPGHDQTYVLVVDASAGLERWPRGDSVVIRGSIAEPPRRGEPTVIQVLRVQRR